MHFFLIQFMFPVISKLIFASMSPFYFGSQLLFHRNHSYMHLFLKKPGRYYYMFFWFYYKVTLKVVLFWLHPVPAFGAYLRWLKALVAKPATSSFLEQNLKVIWMGLHLTLNLTVNRLLCHTGALDEFLYFPALSAYLT